MQTNGNHGNYLDIN